MDVKDWETSRGTSKDDVIALGDDEGISSIDGGGASSEEDITVILVSVKDWVTPVFAVVTLFVAGSSMDDIFLVSQKTLFYVFIRQCPQKWDALFYFLTSWTRFT